MVQRRDFHTVCENPLNYVLYVTNKNCHFAYLCITNITRDEGIYLYNFLLKTFLAECVDSLKSFLKITDLYAFSHLLQAF